MTSRPGSIPAETCEPGADHRNEVVLVGRLAVAPEVRTLPSGDQLTSFRLVVARPPHSSRPRGAQPPSRPVSVDALECVSWVVGVRRSVATWAPGDIVEVTGALRRRFWRSAGGAASRCEVEVARARRIRRRRTPTRRRAAAAGPSAASG